jgi:hypothetical protein
MNRAAVVRQAFLDQAGYCARLGSPFMVALCEGIADVLTTDDPVGRAVLAWPGDPAPLADNVPLRVTGALHALARSGRVRNLTAAFPPQRTPSGPTLAAVLREAFRDHGPEIVEFLAFTPQTNEVGRAAILIGGFLAIAGETALPLDLYEIGASAGLNLLADRYRYRLGEAEWGPKDARLTLTPEWSGSRPPVEARLVVRSRAGCDVNPIDVRDAAERERLASYVWADQPERLERLDAAIETALRAPFEIARADAADWIEARIPAARDGGVRTVFHSIVWNYLPEVTRGRIDARLALVGAKARISGPLAWLRFELDVARGEALLRLTTWPTGEERILASAHPHGRSIRWLGAGAL